MQSESVTSNVLAFFSVGSLTGLALTDRSGRPGTRPLRERQVT
ncbi:hypothetical protein V1282_003812 [Nitrobacteraceae bacterium AZCC 2146]